MLALGIGANAAVFSVIDATLLRRLPFDRPDELVTTTVYTAKGLPFWSSYPDIQEWRAESKTLASIGFYNPAEVYLDKPRVAAKPSFTNGKRKFVFSIGSPALQWAAASAQKIRPQDMKRWPS